MGEGAETAGSGSAAEASEVARSTTIGREAVKWTEVKKQLPPLNARVMCRGKNTGDIFIAKFVDNPLMGYMFENGAYSYLYYTSPEIVKSWARLPI
jgi:hypothetical protein